MTCYFNLYCIDSIIKGFTNSLNLFIELYLRYKVLSFFIINSKLNLTYKNFINCCKLTINETLAKSFGFDLELYKQDHILDSDLNELLVKIAGTGILKHNYFSTTKNKNEISFSNNDKDKISSILIMIMNTWKQHIFYLNNEENKLLTELRDALLPELMSGNMEVDEL